MSQKTIEIHTNALEQFGRIQETCRDERKQALEDRRFCTIPGSQWEGDLAKQYENKPKFEVNKVHLSVIRIINEYRNNRITVDFTPREGGQDELAELCDGLYRADEQDSEAMEAYDNAFEEAVQGGIGAFRLRADYEDEYDEENDKQRIKIEPIYDADISVYFDLDAKRQDKSDAKYCFLVSSMTPEAYKETYDDDPTTWPRDLFDERFDWNTPDVVYVAEYYVVEEKAETKIYFETINGDEEVHWLRDLKEDDKLQDLMDMGHTEVRRRKIKRRKVHKYVMSGGGILEDCGILAGKEIPIVPVYGKRWFVENIERCMGHVRLAKDAQRLKNMQLSKLGEISALASVEKPILTPEQIAGNQKMWAEDNIKNYPYLLINPLTNEEGQTVAQGPIGYTKPSVVPPALAALLQLTEEDMKDILGHYEKGEELESHISGKAVELVQTRLDMQTYIYMSNFAKGLRRCGEIWLSMAKDVYIEDKREMKYVDSEGENKPKKIRIQSVDELGNPIIENDLDNASFDVNVEVGPSSQSKRDSIVSKVTGMIQYIQDPMDQSVLSSMAMMNMDGEGLGDAREYFRKKLVKQGVVAPTEQDQAEMQPDQPSPQDQYALSEAQRAEAEAAKYRADTVETIANAELKKAQAAKIQMDMQIEMNTPPEPPAPAAQPPVVNPDYKEEQILLEAKKAAKELDLKEREIEIKERELELKIAEAGAVLDTSEDGTAAVKNGYADLAEKVSQSIAMAMGELKTAINDQKEAIDDQKEAVEESTKAKLKQAEQALRALSKPKKVIRKDGKIVGIE